MEFDCHVILVFQIKNPVFQTWYLDRKTFKIDRKTWYFKANVFKTWLLAHLI